MDEGREEGHEDTRLADRAILLLRDPSASSYEELAGACKTLQHFAVDTWEEDYVRDAGGIGPLVSLVADDDAPCSTRECAAKALQNLTCGNWFNQEAVRFADGLKPLVQLACQLDASDGAKEASRLAIKNLCEGNEENEKIIRAAGGAHSGARAEPTLPHNWEKNIEFIQRLIGESDLEPEQRALNREVYAPKPTGGVEIRIVSAGGHPCEGQRGLYTTLARGRGEKIIRYIGVVKKRIAGDTGNDYLFAVADMDADLDAERAGNEGRYVNDFRGIAPSKNVQLVDSRATSGELEVWFEAIHPIQPGEELLTCYGRNYSLA